MDLANSKKFDVVLIGMGTVGFFVSFFANSHSVQAFCATSSIVLVIISAFSFFRK